MPKQKKQKQVTAQEAIEKAKVSALARRAKAAEALLEKAFEEIQKMIASGLVRCTLILSEEDEWGMEKVTQSLKDLGYEVKELNDEKTEYHELEISIEHLK